MTEKNERTKAIAIRYNQNEAAPKVIAKGVGIVADNIIKAAQNNTVPIYQNKTLTSMLMAVELDREIPPELYSAIAEVLAYVYRLDQRIGKTKNGRL